MITSNKQLNNRIFMGCGCNGKRKDFITKEKDLNKLNRTNSIIEKNFGSFKGPIDRKRKIAILKRQKKL